MPDNTGDSGTDALPQFAIDPSKMKAALTTLASMIAFASAFSTAILGFVGKHDLTGAIIYLQSAPVITGLATLGGAALVGYRMFRRWMEKKKLNTIVAHVDNRVADFKPGSVAPPEAVAVAIDKLAAGAAGETAQFDPAPLTRAPEPKTPTPVDGPLPSEVLRDGPIITGMAGGVKLQEPQ